jgi:[ribosomal protein S5]-alanine N-acetyltransferase
MEMNQSLTNVRIESGRLLQVPISMMHADEIFKEFSDEVTLYMSPPTPAVLGDTVSFIESAIVSLKEGTNLQMVILDKVTGEFLGCSGVHDLDRPIPELGIWLKKGAHGRKLGMEAVSSLISWAWANLECEFLSYPVDRRNTPSRRIPEAHGGIPVKEWKVKKQNGFVLELAEYRIQRPS